VSGIVPAAVGFERVAAAEAEVAEGRVAAEAELTLLVAIVDGFTPAVAAGPAVVVIGFVAGVLTGRGWDMGVSYRICTCQSCLFCLSKT
jgi:ribosomal protein L13